MHGDALRRERVGGHWLFTRRKSAMGVETISVGCGGVEEERRGAGGGGRGVRYGRGRVGVGEGRVRSGWRRAQ